MPEEQAPINYDQALRDFETENGTLGLEVGAPIDEEMRQRRRRYMQEVLGFQFITEKEAEEILPDGTAHMEVGSDNDTPVACNGVTYMEFGSDDESKA